MMDPGTRKPGSDLQVMASSKLNEVFLHFLLYFVTFFDVFQTRRVMELEKKASNMAQKIGWKLKKKSWFKLFSSLFSGNTQF